MARKGNGRHRADVDRITACVVNPPFAEYRMIHGCDQCGLRPVQRSTTISERDLKNSTVGRAHQVRLDSDLAVRVVETIGVDAFERRTVDRPEPRLLGHPRSEQVVLGRIQLRTMNDGHHGHVTRRRMVARQVRIVRITASASRRPRSVRTT